jgi:hypothetical protein
MFPRFVTAVVNGTSLQAFASYYQEELSDRVGI